MSYARDLIHQAVGCQAGSPECDRVMHLLDEVEDERAHREARRLRQRAALTAFDLFDAAMYTTGIIRGLAYLVDPYEERDGQLFRKSDGQQMTPRKKEGAEGD